MSQALDILRDRFGYASFRFQQQQIVDCLIEGEDALVLMPTGGGKSICYQIPAIARSGVGIIVSPLIALMQDQVDALAQNGVQAAFLNSTQSAEQQHAVRRQLLGGQLDLLYVAPERATTEDFLNLLQQCQLALFAIDEAHCVSQWGHDFRPDYQKLSRLHELFPQVPRIALTATADARTRADIEQQLRLHQARRFIHSFDRPNIFYQISEGANNRQRLWNFIKDKYPEDAGIVYCLSRKQVESTALWLQQKGRQALPYHAGLDKQVRTDHQQRFLREDGLIMVATIAFGMGIDKPDVRFVAHLNLPKNIESYYQETGRAGRDGQAADAWLAYGLQDVITLRQMSQDSDADDAYKRIVHQKLEAMLGFCEQTGCRRQTLLGYFDESLPEPCGHCDNCVNPPQTWDATEASRMALSCVYRTGQRFGVNYVIDVLSGKQHPRIERNGHHQVSTFGIGSFLSSSEWHGLFRQLIAQGYLLSDVHHGALKLTEHSKPLLRGEQKLHLRKQLAIKKSSAESAADNKKPRLRLADQALFEALREHRRQLADQQGVPPFVILHDKTLHDLCVQRPTTMDALQNISGIGSKKLLLYGEDLLDIVEQYPLDPALDNSLSNTVNETLLLFNQGQNAEQIAAQRQMTLTSVYNHLSAAIAADAIQFDQVFNIDREELDKITYALEMAADEQPFKMRTVFESLDGAYDYNLLNCVRASLRG